MYLKNVLFDDGAGEKVHRKLLNKFDLYTILRLSMGIFYNQGVKANVIFFNKCPPLFKGHRTDDIWIYDFRTNTNLSLVINSLDYEHLEDF